MHNRNALYTTDKEKPHDKGLASMIENYVIQQSAHESGELFHQYLPHIKKMVDLGL